MTDQEINQAIAEACGWIDVWRAPNASETAHFVGTSPSGEFLPVPNYCTDLNAMHEAEKVLDCWDDYVSYQSWLGYCGGNVIVQLQQCITATARQRAEAFLLTLGKWSATNKDSLTVGATTEESSVDHLRDGTKMMRFQAAIAAMQGHIVHRGFSENGKHVADLAIRHADALIAALKNEVQL